MTAGVWDRIGALAQRAAGSPMPHATMMRFDEAGKVSEQPQSEVRRDESYFGVTLSEINLARGREWWSSYDPVVYVSLDFVYGRERVSVPRLVGPAALKGDLAADKLELPHGFAVRNIGVAGPHPFRGDRVNLTVILYKVRRTDYARKVLGFAETLSSAVGLPAEIGTVVKIGTSVVDAMEALFEIGDTEAVVGHQVGLNTSPLSGFRTQTVALLAGASPVQDGTRLSEGQLVSSSADGYRASDYVVYSVWAAPSRENESTLPFHDLVPRMYECALAGDDDSWQRGKSILIALYQQMLTSPDLLSREADDLFDQYKTRMLDLRTRAQKAKLMSTRPGAEVSDGGDKLPVKTVQRLNDRTRQVLSF